MSQFDDIELKPQQSPIKPLFTIGKLEDDEAMLKWAKNALEVLIDKETDRHEQVQHNFKMYKGAQAQRREVRPRTQETETTSHKKSREKLVVNYLYDITETQIAKITRYKPAVDIGPANDEYEDKIASKTSKKFLDDIWYRNDIDHILTRLHRRSRVAGEDYLLISYDKDAGDLHPAYKEALKIGEKIPLEDENGNQMTDDSGKPRFIEKPVKLGEVSYQLYSTRQVLCQPQRSWGLVDWVILVDECDVDELKADYPDSADKIKPAAAAMPGMDDNRMRDLAIKNKVLKYTLLHRKTKYVKDGRRVCFTMEAILENEDLPLKEGRLPLVRLTDIDDEEDLHGISYFTNIEGLQNQYNNLSTMILQNQAMCAYPKWMMPKGAASIDSLANDRTIVQYKGAIAPVLVQSNPTPNEVFNFREGLKGEMRQLGGGSQQDRGDPPPGIKAGVALQYLDEQTSERFNVYVQKHNQVIIEIAELTLLTAGENYDDSDGRLERLLGKSSKDAAMPFKISDLTKPYNIRIRNSSALPDSKAAKTQTIIDLKQEFPDIFTSEQVVELLDLGQIDKFTNIATMAIRSAEAENEDMKQGIKVPEPAEYEFHLLHWKVHTQYMQDRSFKELPEEIQILFKDHLMATEMLMYKQAQKNPTFAQQAALLPMFPMLYTPGAPETSSVNPAPAAPGTGPGASAGMPADLAQIAGPPQAAPVSAPPLPQMPPLQATPNVAA